MDTLNPRYLTPNASLNRAKLGPENNITGYEGLSSQFIYRQIQANTARLGISPEIIASPSVDAFIQFDQCFESPDPAIRDVARFIAAQYGRNLGRLLLTLRRGTPESRATRPDWDESYWEYWATIKRIVLGGGLIRGRLRDHLIEDTLAIFAEVGVTPPMLALDPHGAYLPLVGAARCVPAGYRSALALDFGSTQLKRALAQYQGDTLIALDTLTTLPTGWNGNLDKSALQAVLGKIEALICQSWDEAQPDCPIVVISLASYIDPDGHPRERQGSIYALLNTLTPNLQTALTEALRTHTGRDVRVQLIHDGTAGATAHPGCAVITFGTAIGVGYGPAVENPLPRAEVVSIVSHS